MASQIEQDYTQRQKRKWLFLTLAIIILIITLSLVCALLVNQFGWNWTGINGGYPKITRHDTIINGKIIDGKTADLEQAPAKTLWDWLQLLIVPIILAIGGFWLNRFQKSREERSTAQRDKTEREIAADNQREAALQAYIDKIAELLLREEGHLGESPANPQIENIARARTVTVLRILDPVRRGSLLRFLSQAGILSMCIEGNFSFRDLSLHGANLSHTDLSKLNFCKADLSKADLSKADLSKADLRGATLTEATFTEATLRRVDLRGADLRGADLKRADLSEADLSSVSFRKGNLGQMEFVLAMTRANLSKTNLRNANLSWANLGAADLSEADLTGADLRFAHFGRETVKVSKSFDTRKVVISVLPILDKTNLSEADLRYADLSDTTLEDALSLEKADLRDVKGLTKEQLEACKAKGAIIDDDTTTSPLQSPVSPPAPSQSTNVPAPSAPPAQVNTPTPGTDGSSTTSSKPSDGTQVQSAQASTPLPDTDRSSATSSKPEPES